MRHRSASAFAVLLAFAAVPAAAVPGGSIGTLEIGDYTCELPGDATGSAGKRVPYADFTIINSSSYRADGGKGTYLLLGDRVEMTSGPRRGLRYNRLSRGFLRLVGPDGLSSDLRCVLRRGSNG